MARAKLRSITDVFRSVYLVASQQGDDYRVLLFTASPSLQKLPWLSQDQLPEGIYTFLWHRRELTSVVANLRDLGYFVFVYSSEALGKWIDPIDGCFVQRSVGDSNHTFTGIAKWLPPSRTYVELFGGHASLLFARSPSPVELLNDHFGILLNFFRQLRDPTAFGNMFVLSRLYPLELRYDPFLLFSASMQQFESDATKCAFLWYRYLREHFYSAGSVGAVPDSLPTTTIGRILASLRALDPVLVEMHSRIYRAQIEQNTAENVLKFTDSPDTLLWVAPPADGVPGSLSRDATELLLNQLCATKSTVALYMDDRQAHQHFKDFLENVDWLRSSGWTSKRFDNAVVYRKDS